jgi:hypothetical protein
MRVRDVVNIDGKSTHDRLAAGATAALTPGSQARFAFCASGK